MGFSMHLMGFPGYYSVCLMNKHSLVYFENIAVREGSNMLPFYTWKTEAQESYLRWLMFSLKAFFLKSYSHWSQQQPLTLSTPWYPSLLANEQGEFGIVGSCVALEDVMHWYTPTLLWQSHQSTASSALVLELGPVPLPSSPVTLQKSCSSFLRLSFQSQSLCSASPSFIPLLLSSVVQTAQQIPSCNFCLFFACRSPGLLLTGSQSSFFKLI